MIKVSEDLKSLSELRSAPEDVVRQTQESGRPVEAFDELQAAASALELQRAVAAGERALAEGRVIKHEDVMAKWERRLAGGQESAEVRR